MAANETNGNEGKKSAPQIEIDFTGLVLAFSSTALHYLGQMSLTNKEKPATQNLPLAKQNIDILQLLKDKTQNNLTPEEVKLLDQVLADLRLKYVDTAKTQ